MIAPASPNPGSIPAPIRAARTLSMPQATAFPRPAVDLPIMVRVLHRAVRLTRRPITACLMMLLVVLGLPRSASSAEEEALDAQLDASVERGLIFLARQQNRDGAFDGGGPKVAMTGLGVMAFLAAGHTPDVGKHGLVVRNAIDYLVQVAPESGYFGGLDGSRMYGHGIITLALAEAYGVETDPARRERMRAVLARAVKVILDAQAVKKSEPHIGGWRYEQKSADSDLSLSGWNALALRACQNVGLDVPREPIDRAVAYVLKCYREQAPQGFGYQPGRGASAGMTGVGVLNLYLLSEQLHPAADASRKLLAEAKAAEERFPYYSLYYTTQAAFQLGEPTWSIVWKRTREHLIAQQLEDGGWPVSKTGEEPGRVYATSMSVLTLTVPYRLLPIYQR